MLRQRDFVLVWAGETVSALGSAVTVLALPLIAVTVLSASVLQVGVLAALGTVGWLLLSLPVGAGVDRTRKRPLMIGADVLRAALVGSVPLAAVLGVLTIGHLYAVALLCGLLVVAAEVAGQSFVPLLLPPDRLVAGVSGIGTAKAVAGAVGPAVFGLLVGWFGDVARVLLLDAVTFLLSAGCLLAVRRAEPVRGGGPRRRLAREVGDGLRFVLRHPVLRRVVLCSATANLCDVMLGALVVLYLVRELGASPATTGVVLGAGSVGGIAGGLLAAPLARWVGSARALWLGKLSIGAVGLLTPVGGPWQTAVGLFASSAAVMSYNVLQIAYRQQICPPELLGRMNATVRWLIRGLMPAGGLLAGALGTWIGVRPALAVAVVGGWAAVFWLVLSPLRRLRDVPAGDVERSHGLRQAPEGGTGSARAASERV